MADRQDYIRGLREFANWLDERPAVPIPYGELTVNQYCVLEDQRKELAAIGRAMGRADKKTTDAFFVMCREFGNGTVAYNANASRNQVCERIVKGTRKVLKPDYKNVPQVEVEEDIVEWVCPDALLSAVPDQEVSA